MDVVLTQEFLGEEEEADLITWEVADGESVTEGDVLCQFETSKLVSEFNAPASGTLSHSAAEGDVVNVDEAFAKIV